jgi:SAM-dependent methyltransferase
VVHDVRPPILLFFLLTVVSFMPLGQFVGERLVAFRRIGAPLRGYSLDLGGSIAGVVAFSLLSFSHTRPVLWFAIFLTIGMALLLVRRGWAATAVGTFAAGLILGQLLVSDHAQQYSPYYAISVAGDSAMPAVLTNGSLHQIAVPLRRDDVMVNDFNIRNREAYHLPYRFLDAPPKRVLVVGAGTGNDVAVALDEGAEHVDAVEIDPVILDIGRARHPDRPYASGRVRAINLDARSFLNDSRELYDLVVFGTLDSMTRLSALSNVRLDNFVYTIDGIEAARRRLAPGGGMALYFLSALPYLQERLGGMLATSFGDLPIVLHSEGTLFNTLFLAGPAFDHLEGEARQLSPAALAEMRHRVEIPDDDWPFLYLRRREIGPFYRSLILVFAAVSIAAVFTGSGQGRSLVRRVDTEMFLFGFAFLLLETKFVTEMSLLWGATWLTSAVVFGSILVTILLATLAAQRHPLPWRVAFPGLVASLLAVHTMPARMLLSVRFASRLAGSAIFVGAPIFFAATCFAILFEAREDSDRAFGWNLLGAVAGGLAEFLSMIVGLKALGLVALAAYLGAALFHIRSDRARCAAMP